MTAHKEGGSVAALPRPSLKGNILITGGAGFIGRAIIKRAHDDAWDARFTVLSRDEQKQHVVMSRWPDVRCVLGDIRDPERLSDIFAGHDTVLHAAALKYIPEAEFNVKECLDINVAGSRNVINAAHGVVDRVVALSTDKAVSPLNVYGATKMLMERLIVEADLLSTDTRYTCVRYGNVVGSTGSIIPRFHDAILQSQDLPITDPGMTRFWLSVDEAIDLIIHACSVDDRGVTVIPKARSTSLDSIVDALSIVTGKDCQTHTVGIRPGEKLSEALINEHESLRTVWNDPYWYLLPQGRSGDGESFMFDSALAEDFFIDDMIDAIKLAALV